MFVEINEHELHYLKISRVGVRNISITKMEFFFSQPRARTWSVEECRLLSKTFPKLDGFDSEYSRGAFFYYERDGR